MGSRLLAKPKKTARTRSTPGGFLRSPAGGYPSAQWCEGANCGCSAVCRSDNSVPPLNAEVANIDAM